MATFSVYILTNWTRTVLYIGMTADLTSRLAEHRSLKNPAAFTAKYKCFHLVYFEEYTSLDLAIQRERELKGWRRSKKLELIGSANPTLTFLDESGFDVQTKS